MSKKRRHSRQADADRETRGMEFPPAFPGPTLHRLAQEIAKAEEVYQALYQDNQRLQDQVGQQRQELEDGKRRIADLEAQCESLDNQVARLQEDVEQSRADALRTLFADMSSERHNRMLRKLLAYDCAEPGLLADMVRYLKTELNLALEGEVGSEITLTQENLDEYELNEQVALPSRARIIGRGISFKGQVVLRTQVERVEEAASDGH